MDFETIEKDNIHLIDIAKKYMETINDKEHDTQHMIDVVNYTKELLNSLESDANAEVCLLSAYWHDVGRIKLDSGHEKLSADMMKEEMERLNYDNKMIESCYLAVLNHGWFMIPTTIEGLIVKDADKLGWLGENRWNNCLSNNQRLNSIIDKLSELRNKYLFFEESKKIYDRDIVRLLKKIYTTYNK